MNNNDTILNKIYTDLSRETIVINKDDTNLFRKGQIYLLKNKGYSIKDIIFIHNTLTKNFLVA